MKKSILIMLVIILAFAISYSYAVEVTLLGPKQYVRTTGKPNIFNDSFPGRPGQGKIIVQNGGLSSAIVKVNGIEIFGVNDFNQRVRTLEAQVSIGEDNSVTVELRSKPGSFLSIEVEQKIDAAGAALISFSGGVVEVVDSESPLYGARLEIPPGALNNPAIISVNESSVHPPLPDGWGGGDIPIELQPSGIYFSEPANLIIPTNGITERNFFFYDENEQSWNLLDTLFNDLFNQFEVKIQHFSIINWLCAQAGSNCRAFIGCSTIKYWINPYSNHAPGYSASQITNAIKNAINEWAVALNGRLYFIETTNESEANIKFFWSASYYLFYYYNTLRPNTEALGHTAADLSGRMLIRFNDGNDQIRWVADNSSSSGGIPIEFVALHEIGHALGLSHRCPSGSNTCDTCITGPVMAPNAGDFCHLTSNDIARIQSLYSSCGSTQNLFPNPSLEYGSGQWPDGWSLRERSLADVYWDSTNSHSGNKALRVVFYGINNSYAFLISDYELNVNPGEVYEISYWIYRSPDYESGDFHCIQYGQYNGSYWVGSLIIPPDYWTTKGQWIRCSKQITIEEWATKLKLAIERSCSYSPEYPNPHLSSGTVWFDDLEVRRIR